MQRTSLIFLIISLDGVNAIKQREGLRLSAYADDGGRSTIGYGHAYGVRADETITEVEATKLLYADLDVTHSALKLTVSVPLFQYEYDALMSFVYNIGGVAWKRSTMLRHLNEADYKRVATDFDAWRFVNSVEDRGLLARRRAEARQFANS